MTLNNCTVRVLAHVEISRPPGEARSGMECGRQVIGRGGASLLTQEVPYLHTCSLGALLAQPQILPAPQDLSALSILHQGAVTHPSRVQHCNVWELSS